MKVGGNMQNFIKPIISAIKFWVTEKINEETTSINNDITSINNDINSINTDINSINSEISSINTEIDSINSEMETMNQSFDEQLKNSTADWSISDETNNGYIKNRTHYDDTESGGELKKLDNKYLSDEVVKCNSAEVGQMIVVKSINENGVPVEWEAVDGQASQNKLILIDEVNGNKYVVYMRNGTLVSNMNKIVNFSIDTLPDKTDYTNSEEFDPTGMVASVTYLDGTTEEITDYSYNSYVSTGSDSHAISYQDANGTEYTAEIPITTRSIEDSLVDFYYDKNDDGTYTITGWKETLNGVSSTECVVPNSNLIYI